MSMRIPGCRSFATVVLVATGLGLTGCVSTSQVDDAATPLGPSSATPNISSSTPPPTTPPAATPRPDIAPPPYRVPEKDPAEVARIVHETGGPDGPVTSSETLAEVEPDVEYSLEVDCRAPGIEDTITVRWRDAAADVQEPGDGGGVTTVCDGLLTSSGIVFTSPTVLQLTLEVSDGVEAAWARMLPTR